ncbi:MAG TPA: group 1 truncated hemoglobin [Polyangiaceae bacterium]|jgi:truncated hemoglobin YjbI|nr:group 1 truncated hemoglobin [Polyangiaceae bacterium]
MSEVSSLGPRGSRKRALEPHPELWDRLERGALLRKILEAFYAKVYRDDRLMPFFERTSVEWAIDHQYAFLAQIFSGEKLFFGDRPRNAHHWMVIDDALFDYREELMMRTLEELGLEEGARAEWREVEECFRHHIVKASPRALMRGGKILPLEGYETLVLSSGGLCDSCGEVVPSGEEVSYHVRTGKVACAGCTPAKGGAA